MVKKLHVHNLTIGGKRTVGKKTRDIREKNMPKKNVQNVFDTYYRDQVRALYRAISKD